MKTISIYLMSSLVLMTSLSFAQAAENKAEFKTIKAPEPLTKASPKLMNESETVKEASDRKLEQNCFTDPQGC
ncbi:MAG: hypothetical protein HYX35_03145 [Proteobacteria bacterium]|nr:hypothetical protein [Pseudomonadota bacterium]